jgi:hypothetical protein
VKRILSLAALAFVVSAHPAYADSTTTLDINIAYATAGMGPDGGVVFTLYGPGTPISGYGGMACFSWCSGPIPDLSFVSEDEFFLGFNFDFFPAMNGNAAFYQFSSGSFTAATPPTPTPEPGTLGLILIGLAGIVGVVRRKRASLGMRTLVK